MYSSPGLADVDHVDSIWTSLPQVWLHVDLQVLGADVTLSREQHLNVLRGGIEDGGEIVGRHVRGPDLCKRVMSRRPPLCGGVVVRYRTRIRRMFVRETNVISVHTLA